MPQLARQTVATDALPAAGLPQDGHGFGTAQQALMTGMLTDPHAFAGHPPQPITERAIAVLSRCSGLVALALAYAAVARLLVR